MVEPILYFFLQRIPCDARASLKCYLSFHLRSRIPEFDMRSLLTRGWHRTQTMRKSVTLSFMATCGTRHLRL